MKTYELSYEFPLGSGKRICRDLTAEDEKEAYRLARISNPTLVISEVERHPIARYLKSENGQQFVLLLRKFEHRLYAKVRRPKQFFDRYYTITGDHLSPQTVGILISEQKDKWGDELMISFSLEGFSPDFPVDANPRLYDGGKGILNDNEYIWYLIEQHGFRFGKVSQALV